MFDGCATDNTRTCVYSARTFPDTGLDGICFGASDRRVACSSIAEGMDYFGQDGHYPGPARSFTDLGDGRVLDEVTLRVWTKTVVAAMNWSAARDHCRDLPLGAGAWRLPLRYELQALVNYAPDGATGLDAPFDASGATLIWTGTSLAGDESSTAWAINVLDGTVQRLGKVSAEPRALCVEE